MAFYYYEIEYGEIDFNLNLYFKEIKYTGYFCKCLINCILQGVLLTRCLKRSTYFAMSYRSKFISIVVDKFVFSHGIHCQLIEEIYLRGEGRNRTPAYS